MVASESFLSSCLEASIIEGGGLLVVLFRVKNRGLETMLSAGDCDNCRRFRWNKRGEDTVLAVSAVSVSVRRCDDWIQLDWICEELFCCVNGETGSASKCTRIGLLIFFLSEEVSVVGWTSFSSKLQVLASESLAGSAGSRGFALGNLFCAGGVTFMGANFVMLGPISSCIDSLASFSCARVAVGHIVVAWDTRVPRYFRSLNQSFVSGKSSVKTVS